MTAFRSIDRYGNELLSPAPYANVAAFPATGVEGLVYADTSSVPNPLYRWNAATSAYVKIGGGGSSSGGVVFVDQINPNIAGSKFSALSNMSVLDPALGASLEKTYMAADGTFWVYNGAAYVLRGQVEELIVQNPTGTVISPLKAVSIIGGAGLPLVNPSDKDIEALAHATIGLTSGAIASGQSGLVVSNGLLQGVDTSAWAAGSELWVGDNGGLVNVKPVAPAHAISVGWVVSSGVSGAVYVTINKGADLASLHDVNAAGATVGQGLVLNSAGVWVPGIPHPYTTSLTPQVYQGSAYVSAKADVVANVADIIRLSDGSRLTTGYVTWTGHGLTVGNYYFLSQSAAGGYTNVVPATGISQRLFYVEDANTIHILVEPANVYSSGTLTSNEVGVLVPLDTPVALDNIRVEARLTGGQGFRIGTVSGAMVCDVSAVNSYAVDAAYASNRVGVSLTTTMTHPFNWIGETDGDTAYGTIHDRTNNKVYEFTVKMSVAPVLSFIRIKRLVGAATQPFDPASTIPVANYGDVKQGLQAADHSGWIKLDGRLKNSLTPTQQAQATALGLGVNLPNANYAYLVQGPTLGVVAGSNSRTLTQSNLPNISLTAASAGAHQHPIGTRANDGGYANGAPNAFHTGILSPTNADITDRVNTGTATTGIIKSAGAHTHSVPLGGSGAAIDISPQSLGVNTFVYLGA